MQVINQPAPVKSHIITIPKDQRVMEALRQRYIENEKGEFSASAIIQYISCPVRFYLDQLAGLRPADNANDALETNVMGLVLHGAMQILYTGYTEINATLIESLHERAEEAVLKSVAEHYRPGPLFGHDLLMKEVIIKLVHRILESDRNDAPFRIFGLEKELKRTIQIDGSTIRLKGYIDRVDIRNEVMRVLDYKTGKTPAALPKDRSRIFSDPEHKVAFQLLMYLYLIQEEKTTSKAIAGIFPLSQEKQFVFLKGDDEELLRETDFEAGLIHIIREIFDTSKPFSQTNDIRRCEYCDFAGICRRN
jgi:ATP-dependent helicase/DNAse subunit B